MIKTTNNIINRRNAILNKLQSAANIVIYGAGIYGERVFRILYNEGLSDKLLCFAVTNDLTKTKIGNRKIIQIQKVVEDTKNVLYIVAAAKESNAYKEMTNKLEEMQILNYISGNELIDNFYIV